MRFRIRLAYAVIAAVNAAALIGAAALTVAGSSMAKSQRYNSAADVWRGSSKMNFTQVSCFFEGGEELTTDFVAGVEADLTAALKEVAVTEEEGEDLIAYGYSAPLGTYTVTGDIPGQSEAELTAVGGDFFLFRQFELISGAYFSDDDIMQDGAVIDRTLAYSLYGSDDVAGMSVYINGQQFYIAGVIADPQTEPEKQCAGDKPRAYVSYETADLLAGEYNEYTGTSSFRHITCYECVLPDPVDGFAYGAVKKHFEGTTVSVVNNTARFKPSVRAKRYKRLSDYAVHSSGTVYPYWENASRIVEFRLSQLYHFRRLLLIVPVLTLIWLAVIGYRALKKQGRRLFSSIALKLSHLRWRLIQRSAERKEKRSQKAKESQ
jgi:hypothetical protein